MSYVPTLKKKIDAQLTEKKKARDDFEKLKQEIYMFKRMHGLDKK